MTTGDGSTGSADRSNAPLTIELRSDGRIRVRRETPLGSYAETIER